MAGDMGWPGVLRRYNNTSPGEGSMRRLLEEAEVVWAG